MPSMLTPRTPANYPPPRIPVPVEETMQITGERVIMGTPGGTWRHDLRATSNVYIDQEGRLLVDVVPEEEWYRLKLTGAFSDGTTTGKVQSVSALTVFVEVLQPFWSSD
ncbi:hypothetical protein [Thermobispora bispora]|uniref:hypothetical protein n=1 Tax=Thermobispora bispora TaxID=2006 RepID=UPI001980595C|nr:hypothetical protein [Thermobispora bispora]